MKNCNNQGFCGYRCFNGTLCECSYDGYCDFQAPRDSRFLNTISDTFKPVCTCGTGSSLPCPLHQPNG